jgi:hypothetical protein
MVAAKRPEDIKYDMSVLAVPATSAGEKTSRTTTEEYAFPLLIHTLITRRDYFSGSFFFPLKI